MSVELGCRRGESERTPEEKCPGQSLGGLGAPVPWLDEECLPEVTFLDVTCDSALPCSLPATPVTAGPVKSRLTSLQPSQSSSSTSLNGTTQILCPQNKTRSLLQSNVSRHKEEREMFKTKPYKENGPKTLSETSSSDSMSDKENNSEASSPVLSKHNGTTATEALDTYMAEPPESMHAPVRWLDVRYYPEITLLDVTHDSEASPKGNVSYMDNTQDTSPVENNMPPSEFSEQIAAEPGRLDTNQNEESSSTITGNVTHTTSSLSEQSDKSVENIPQNSLEVTRKISTGSVVENGTPPLEPSGPNMVKIQTSPEKTLGTNPANVTHDISSSSDVSVRSAASQFSTSDTQFNTTSENVTSELHGESAVTSNTVEANTEELLTNHDELISKVPQSSPKTSGTVSSPLTSLQPSQLSSSTNLNTTTEISGSLNKTLDLPSSNVNSPKTNGATDQATSVSKNTNDISLSMNQNCSAVKASGACDIQSLQNTFDTKTPKQNGTITLSETSSSGNHHSTFDKMLVTPECTFEGNPSVEVASGTGRRETKDHSQSALSFMAGLSDTLSRQSKDAENRFNLDDTLDLKTDLWITSTPMTNCKILNLNTHQEERKIFGAQKKLYVDGSRNTDAQVPSDVPSNLACDQKTFLSRPAAKSLLPPSKATSQLLKHKQASALLTTLTSGLSMTRQRTQAEALRNTAASESSQTTGIPSSYKFRATTTASKQTNLGLQRPRLSGIPSSIQKDATGLRPPSARSNASASSSANKLCGPTATNTMRNTTQAKRPTLTRGETLPVPKRKKMDAPLPSCLEVSTSSCAAANRARSLKQPTTNKRALPAKTPRDDAAVPASTSAEISTSSEGVGKARALKQPGAGHRALLVKPKGHGCSNCVALEQQLKAQSEEIRRLKEELLKKSKEEQDG